MRVVVAAALGPAPTYRSLAVLLDSSGDPRTAEEAAVPREITGTGDTLPRWPTKVNFPIRWKIGMY